MTFTIFGKTERPSVWLSRQTIDRLSAIGASLDIDMYDLVDYRNDKDAK